MNEFSYSNREGVMAPVQKYLIRTDGLHIAALTVSGEETPVLIPWSAVVAVHLCYAGNRYVTYRRACILRLQTGQELKIFSASYSSFARFSNQAESFNQFVINLHKHLHRFAPACSFGRSVGWHFKALRTLFASALVSGFLALVFSFVPALWQWLRNGYSGSYDPTSVPARLLAKE